MDLLAAVNQTGGSMVREDMARAINGRGGPAELKGKR